MENEKRGSLVVRRKPGESILITTPGGETIEVQSTSRDAATLRIEAPLSCKILRKELNPR